MAAETRTYAVTVPAGTLATAPQTTPLTMPSRIVRHIRMRIPPGPRGLVGFRLSVSGTQLIPWGAGTWLIADDEVIDLDPTNAPDSGDWSVVAYNTGLLSHTLYFTLDLDPVGSRIRTPGVTIVSIQP